MRKRGELYQRERWFRTNVIRNMLHQCRGNRTITARHLGITRTYLLELMKGLGLQDGRGKIGGQTRERWKKTA